MLVISAVYNLKVYNVFNFCMEYPNEYCTTFVQCNPTMHCSSMFSVMNKPFSTSISCLIIYQD